MADQAPSTRGASAVSQAEHHDSAAHSNHGNTVAAWTTVGILIVAALIMCLAVVFATVWLFVVGVVVVVVALVAGKLLSMAGYGMPRPDDDRVTRGVR